MSVCKGGVMWCTCTSRGKTSAGYTKQPDSDLWVCGKCLLPSKMVFEKVTDMLVPYGATAALGVRGRADGIHETTFATQSGKVVCLTYHPYPRKVDMEQGRALLQETWKLLDDATDKIMSLSNDPWSADNIGMTGAKAEARAYANVLALFMKPFFTNADDIVREAVKRHKARQAGEEHVTPGLAEHIWDPTKNWDGSDRVGFENTPKSKVSVLEAKLQPEQKTFVTKALADGIMDPAALAGMFKVPVSVIEECRG